MLIRPLFSHGISWGPPESLQDRRRRNIEAAAIQEITLDGGARGVTKRESGRRSVRLKLADKVRNLELLGKYLRIFGVNSVSLSEPVRAIVVDSPRPCRPPIPTLENEASTINGEASGGSARAAR